MYLTAAQRNEKGKPGYVQFEITLHGWKVFVLRRLPKAVNFYDLFILYERAWLTNVIYVVVSLMSSTAAQRNDNNKPGYEEFKNNFAVYFVSLAMSSELLRPFYIAGLAAWSRDTLMKYYTSNLFTWFWSKTQEKHVIACASSLSSLVCSCMFFTKKIPIFIVNQRNAAKRI